MMKAFSYYRNSTSDQKELATEENQRTLCKAFALENGVDIVHEYKDLGRSGLSEDGRPEYRQMLDKLDAVDGLIVYDMDRLNRDLWNQISLLILLIKNKKKLFLARERVVEDWSSRTNILIRLILAWVGQEEVLKSKERQKAGIERYRANHEDRWGRSAAEVDWKKYDEYVDMGLSKVAIAKLFGMSRKTLYKRLEERK